MLWVVLADLTYRWAVPYNTSLPRRLPAEPLLLLAPLLGSPVRATLAVWGISARAGVKDAGPPGTDTAPDEREVRDSSGRDRRGRRR